MPNNNDLINLVNNKKPVELVQELKDYEIKKSSLSPAARGKVINKSGSDYVSEDRGGYGPTWVDPDIKEFARKEREEEERRYPKFCKANGCSVKIQEWRTYCYCHEDNPNYVTEQQKRDGWIKWGIKTVSGVGISAALGPVGSVITGGAGWLGGKIGEAASDSRDAKEFWSSVSGFGGDIAKGELAGELWGIGGSEIAKELGASASKGFKAGEFSYSVYSTGEEAIVHQNHLDRGEGYKSSCKVCNP